MTAKIESVDPTSKTSAPAGRWAFSALVGGNLALSRFYSKYLALQLKARMEGLETPVYGKPD